MSIPTNIAEGGMRTKLRRGRSHAEKIYKAPPRYLDARTKERGEEVELSQKKNQNKDRGKTPSTASSMSGQPARGGRTGVNYLLG